MLITGYNMKVPILGIYAYYEIQVLKKHSAQIASQLENLIHKYFQALTCITVNETITCRCYSC